MGSSFSNAGEYGAAHAANNGGNTAFASAHTAGSDRKLAVSESTSPSVSLMRVRTRV
jgi:hypothetical protein